MQAHEELARVDKARCLLAICKADIAAAHGSLKNAGDAIKYARESISIIEGVEDFSQTEAAANMTIGCALFTIGKSIDAQRYLDSARRIFGAMPDGAQYLQMLDRNETYLKSRFPESEKKWWQLWK